MKLVPRERPAADYVVPPELPERLDRVWGRIAGQAPQKRPRFLARGAVVAAIAAILVAAMLPLVFGGRRSPATPDVQSMAGLVLSSGDSEQNVALPEGSRLELGPKTRLEILAASQHEVRLRLEEGRVTCDVTRITTRPFIVSAGDTETEVKGTRFEVALSPVDGGSSRIHVKVERGAVAVRSARDESVVTLAPGESWSSPPGPARSASVGEPAVIVSSRPSSTPQLSAPPSLGAKGLFERPDAARPAGRVGGAAVDFQRLMDRFPNDPRAPVAAYELGRLRTGPLHDPAGGRAAFQFALDHDREGILRESAEIGRIQATALLGDNAQCVQLRDAFLAAHSTSAQQARVRGLCGGS